MLFMSDSDNFLSDLFCLRIDIIDSIISMV